MLYEFANELSNEFDHFADRLVSKNALNVK